MDVNVVTAISRSLRKIYAITKQNMDLLDKAVVQSFIECFPNDSTKIRMGKMGLKVHGNLSKRRKSSLSSNGSSKLKQASPKKQVLKM